MPRGGGESRDPGEGGGQAEGAGEPPVDVHLERPPGLGILLTAQEDNMLSICRQLFSGQEGPHVHLFSLFQTEVHVYMIWVGSWWSSPTNVSRHRRQLSGIGLHASGFSCQ